MKVTLRAPRACTKHFAGQCSAPDMAGDVATVDLMDLGLDLTSTGKPRRCRTHVDLL